MAFLEEERGQEERRQEGQREKLGFLRPALCPAAPRPCYYERLIPASTTLKCFQSHQGHGSDENQMHLS